MKCKKCGLGLAENDGCELCGKSKGLSKFIKIGALLVGTTFLASCFYVTMFLEDKVTAQINDTVHEKAMEFKDFYVENHPDSYRGMQRGDSEYVMRLTGGANIQVTLNDVGDITQSKLTMTKAVYNVNPQAFEDNVVEMLNYFGRDGVNIIESLEVKEFDASLYELPKLYIEDDREYQFLGVESTADTEGLIVFSINFK